MRSFTRQLPQTPRLELTKGAPTLMVTRPHILVQAGSSAMKPGEQSRTHGDRT